jgi:hypothetical protein
MVDGTPGLKEMLREFGSQSWNESLYGQTAGFSEHGNEFLLKK